MYTKLATEMIRYASKRAKTMIDVHETFRRAGSVRIHDLRNAPAVTMAPDGEYLVLKTGGYGIERVECKTAEEASTVLETALNEMSVGKGKATELFETEMAEYFS